MYLQRGQKFVSVKITLESFEAKHGCSLNYARASYRRLFFLYKKKRQLPKLDAAADPRADEVKLRQTAVPFLVVCKKQSSEVVR